MTETTTTSPSGYLLIDEWAAENGCSTLGSLLGALIDRGEQSQEEVCAWLEDIDPDELWNSFGGPVVDALQDLMTDWQEQR